MAAEGSFWLTLLLRRRRRGRFGLLCFYNGGGEVVLAYSIIPTAAEIHFGLHYYFYGGGGECTAKVI